MRLFKRLQKCENSQKKKIKLYRPILKYGDIYKIPSEWRSQKDIVAWFGNVFSVAEEAGWQEMEVEVDK